MGEKKLDQFSLFITLNYTMVNTSSLPLNNDIADLQRLHLKRGTISRPYPSLNHLSSLVQTFTAQTFPRQSYLDRGTSVSWETSKLTIQLSIRALIILDSSPEEMILSISLWLLHSTAATWVPFQAFHPRTRYLTKSYSNQSLPSLGH